MKKISIIYGSSTGNAQETAEKIAELLSEFSPQLKDVAQCSADDFTAADCLILGTSTWGLGDLQDDWYDMLPRLKSVDLSGKIVALFGLGDASGYSDTFVDGMGELYEFFFGKGCKIVGSVATAGYSFDDSRAVVDNKFVGLPIDVDNESDLTDERVSSWVQNIKPSF
jgi:flavodoxin I